MGYGMQSMGSRMPGAFGGYGAGGVAKAAPNMPAPCGGPGAMMPTAGGMQGNFGSTPSMMSGPATSGNFNFMSSPSAPVTPASAPVPAAPIPGALSLGGKTGASNHEQAMKQVLDSLNVGGSSGSGGGPQASLASATSFDAQPTSSLDIDAFSAVGIAGRPAALAAAAAPASPTQGQYGFRGTPMGGSPKMGGMQSMGAQQQQQQQGLGRGQTMPGMGSMHTPMGGMQQMGMPQTGMQGMMGGTAQPLAGGMGGMGMPAQQPFAGMQPQKGMQQMTGSPFGFS